MMMHKLMFFIRLHDISVEGHTLSLMYSMPDGLASTKSTIFAEYRKIRAPVWTAADELTFGKNVNPC